MVSRLPSPSNNSITTVTTHSSTSAEEGRVWVKVSAIQAATAIKVPFGQRRAAQHDSSTADTESCTSSVRGDRQLSWHWREGVLVESTSSRLQVQFGSSEVVTFAAAAWSTGDMVPANTFEIDPVTGLYQPPSDLVTLTHLDEPAVVESLQHRFAADRIYTNTGPVLLAVNPFRSVRGLYGEMIQKRYWDRAERPGSTTELPPHVYAIADSSFRSMMRALEDHVDTTKDAADSSKSTTYVPAANQSILVSGESGAGKTVTTKFVMKYLAALSQRSSALRVPEKRAHERASWRTNNNNTSFGGNNNNNSTSSNSNAIGDDLASATLLSAGTSIEAIVLHSNPILESFGNARTVRNDNSSRFGKFIEMQFTPTGKLVGARIDTYLLEKVRLGVQQAGERNFHVFYELLSGALTPQELSRFFLAPTALPEDFVALAGTYDRRDGVSDQETCHGLLAAMRAMQFSEEDAVSVLGTAAAVLHGFNMQFVETNDTAVLDECNPHLPAICHLLGVEATALEEALTGCTIQAGQEQQVRRTLNLEQAHKGLEALLQTVYGALFEYLVQRINDSIATENTPAASIGVLDIFGFESFQTNSFEQLCINYCNEALQQQFNAFVLKNEQAEYEREGIEWSFIEFPENQDVLDLIDKKGSGILSILDDQCRAPGPSDRAFVLNVYNTCKSKARFSTSRKQTANLQFSVHHYAGPVEYTTEGFVQKNRDELPKETTELLKSSELPFIQGLAAIIEARRAERAGTSNKRQFHRVDSTVGRATVGGQFRRQLRELRNKIEVTSPHYVRCLKPNDLLVPDVFDTAIVAEQLRCGGILEAVRVARAGFTQHYPHADFCRRYRALAWTELNGYTSPKKQDSNSNGNSNKYAGWNNSRSFANHSYNPSVISSSAKKQETKGSDTQTECKKLIKALCRKLRDGDDFGVTSPPTSPTIKATTYSAQKNVPSWSKVRKTEKADLPPPSPTGVKARYQPNASPKTPYTPKTHSPWKRGVTASDFAKVGIQMGKTKVFLRHQCFESLERLRSVALSTAAIKLNSFFRMYLARMAYVPYRNAFRREMLERGSEDDRFEEKKESDLESVHCSKYRSFRANFSSRGYSKGVSLVSKWMTSRVRDAIHNPVPRHQWGQQAPSTGNFRWILSEGLWVKNYD